MRNRPKEDSIKRKNGQQKNPMCQLPLGKSQQAPSIFRFIDSVASAAKPNGPAPVPHREMVFPIFDFKNLLINIPSLFPFLPPINQ